MTDVDQFDGGASEDEQCQIIPSHLAITAMRDSGYKNTAYALAELIDNSQQAGASDIELLCFEREEVVRERRRSRIAQIAVIDNGSGMSPSTLRMALQFGNGLYLNNRSGIGRFGMGLPNASISQAGRVDVWTWTNGPDNAIHTNIDVNAIESGEMQFVPEPAHYPLPEEWRIRAENVGRSGTLVVWSRLDLHRLTWKRAKTTLENTGRLVGRIYRHFIVDGTLSVRLYAEDEEENVIRDDEAEINDPLYLMPSPLVPEPFKNFPMFDLAREDVQEIEYEGKRYEVNVRYSVAKPETVEYAGTRDRGKTKYGQHARNNIGVSLIRAGRELMLDHGWCIGYDPRERWWGCEVVFPPELDELFGVTNNKQAATHFSELATIDWEQLAEEGEDFRDVVTRLKDEGDPRGWLLAFSDSLKRDLQGLRSIIKGQASGGRSTRKTRHDEPDDVTATVNKGWKGRSKEKPIQGEDVPFSDDVAQEIHEDLTNNKKYSESDARDLVDLIKERELNVVFLEADFPDRYHLFNVENKGSVTEITFNRKHPAFDDVFGTVNTVDEDINDLTREEVLERLVRAINATKVIFAGWARYEREAGVDRAKALEKVRLDWGQIAAMFLDPEDEGVL